MCIKYRLLWKTKGSKEYKYREFFTYSMAKGFYLACKNSVDLVSSVCIIKRETDFEEPLQENYK